MGPLADMEERRATVSASSARPRPHWVSRCLTKEWEVNEKRKRELVPFVVNTGHVERPVSSKRLFREDRGRSQEL